MELLGKIQQVLLEFVTWLWNGLVPPKRKSWCAIFYFVAQQDAGMDYPETDLDMKLTQILDVLEHTSFDDTQTHVVYRAVWASESTDPVAKVVSASLLPPMTDYFPRCSVDTTLPLNTGEDLPCFLKWAYNWCPADHYAIFFWGHSFGPAGLFEPGGVIGIPRPTGLESLREAFDQFTKLRTAPTTAMVTGSSGTGSIDGPYIATPPPPPSAPVSVSTATHIIQGIANSDPRVEVVLFQDCWMSTLETAYELRDVVRYVIASQSLLPIGIDYAEFVWPYEQLLKDLLASDFQDQLTRHLGDFYDENFSEIATLDSVPLALLDLSAVGGITKPLNDLVKVLKLALTLEARGLVIERGQIVAFDSSGDLSVGDAALVDVRKLCEHLQNDADAGISAAALSVLASLGPLIKMNRESLPSNGSRVGFGGISVLYRPPPDLVLDDYITQALHKASYMALKFSKETKWPATEQRRQT